MTKPLIIILLIPIIIAIITTFFYGESESHPTKAEMEVRQVSEAYSAALNRKDANALLDFWADNAVYRNPLTGKLVEGKREIKKEYQQLFDEMKDSKVEMKIHSISFPYDDKAVEEGTIHLQIPGEKTMDHDYTMIYVKKAGKWKILNVSEINLISN